MLEINWQNIQLIFKILQKIAINIRNKVLYDETIHKKLNRREGKIMEINDY